MTYTCRNCKRTFTRKLQFELHRDTCSSVALICERCGDQFPEREATRDGWHYECPNDDCTGEGRGDDLHSVRDFTIATRTH